MLIVPSFNYFVQFQNMYVCIENFEVIFIALKMIIYENNIYMFYRVQPLSQDLDSPLLMLLIENSFFFYEF